MIVQMYYFIVRFWNKCLSLVAAFSVTEMKYCLHKDEPNKHKIDKSVK